MFEPTITRLTNGATFEVEPSTSCSPAGDALEREVDDFGLQLDAAVFVRARRRPEQSVAARDKTDIVVGCNELPARHALGTAESCVSGSRPGSAE